MTNLDHIRTLINHGACIRAGEQQIPLTEDFCHQATEQCRSGGYNAVTYDLILPGIEEPMMLAVWADGHADSGSAKSICDCLASR